MLPIICVGYVNLLTRVLPNDLMSTTYTDAEACLINVAYIARKNPVFSYHLIILFKPASEDVRIVCVLSFDRERLADNDLILWESLHPS
jgi:hypothetical protein